MNADKTIGGIALAALLAMAASALLLTADFRSEVENHRQVMLARGETALDALVAGIRAQGRMGRYRNDRLSVILEELADAPDIRGVALYAAGGKVISSGGDVAALTLEDGDGIHWAQDHLCLIRGLVLDLGAHGYGRGRGGPGNPELDSEAWEPFPDGPHFLGIVLDTSALSIEIRGDRVRYGISLVVAALLVGLGSALAVGVVRGRRLQTALLVAREQAAHQAQLTQLGAGLAHETKNPLGIVRGQAQLIADAPEDAAGNHERAGRIIDEIDRTVGHINGFLTLARPRDITLVSVALGHFLEGFAALMEGEAKQQKVFLSVTAADVSVRADEGQLRKALLNLVLNALHACRPGDRIAIEVGKNSGTVDLLVRDSGRGIAPEDLPRVTEPYFTRSDNGCGLGLTLVDQIARAHGWTLHIDSTPGTGTTVSLKGIERVSAADER